MSFDKDIAEKEPKMSRLIHNEIEVDIISTMPDSIILHIMNFLITKEAVQTCILSKRWKNLWRYLPTLNISREHLQQANMFKKFVNKFLQHREDSSALHTIDVDHEGYVCSQILRKMINYAISHKVEQFKVDIYLHVKESNMLLFHSIFSLHSLKCLDLSFDGIGQSGWIVKLPETLDLPELVSCRLINVTITLEDGNDCAKPFLKCKKLGTLIIDNFKLIRDDKVFCISGEKLASLTIRFGFYDCKHLKVQISAPNLKSLHFEGYLTSNNNHQFIEHNLDFIEHARISVWSILADPKVVEASKKLFKRISNVHSLILSSSILKGLSLIPNFPNIEPIGFGKLKSLTVLCYSEGPMFDDVMKYLLQDSPHAARRFHLR